MLPLGTSVPDFVLTNAIDGQPVSPRDYARSEEHTSELQSQSNLVCRLLLEKKKNAQRIATSEAASRTLITPDTASSPTPPTLTVPCHFPLLLPRCSIARASARLPSHAVQTH